MYSIPNNPVLEPQKGYKRLLHITQPFRARYEGLVELGLIPNDLRRNQCWVKLRQVPDQLTQDIRQYTQQIDISLVPFPLASFQCRSISEPFSLQFQCKSIPAATICDQGIQVDALPLSIREKFANQNGPLVCEAKVEIYIEWVHVHTSTRVHDRGARHRSAIINIASISFPNQ